MATTPDPSGTAERSATVPARLTVFGHDPVKIDITVVPRSPAWRLRRTVTAVLVFGLILPVAALIPPHAPWVAAVVTAAIVVGRRRWTERFSVMRFEAPCPRCESVVVLRPGSRLRERHPIPCEGCGHEALLVADLEGRPA